MGIQELIQKVLNKQPAAAALAGELGQKANDKLIELTKHVDADVRRVALYCLCETGGPDAVLTFVDLLQDKDSQVRGAALEGLMHHPDPSACKLLLSAYDSNPHAGVRQNIMLILGKMSNADIEQMRQRYQHEQDAEAKEGSIVALSRLGDIAARGDFIRLLHGTRDRRRTRFLQEYCRYINAPWLRNTLLPVLDDRSKLVFVGIDFHPELPQYVRACDLAVNLIASIGERTFSFPIKTSFNYTDEQIAEVRDYVQSFSPF